MELVRLMTHPFLSLLQVETQPFPPSHHSLKLRNDRWFTPIKSLKMCAARRRMKNRVKTEFCPMQPLSPLSRMLGDEITKISLQKIYVMTSDCPWDPFRDGKRNSYATVSQLPQIILSKAD